jgi:hypothetical protein
MVVPSLPYLITVYINDQVDTLGHHFRAKRPLYHFWLPLIQS